MKVDYERNASARMFQSDFMERTSQVHPSIPFIFYIPLVMGLLAYGLTSRVTTVIVAAPSFVAGWIVWQWMEYGIHRSFFHWEGNGPLTRRLHDIIHGYHHRYPDDAKRLVMPLGASIPLAIVIAGLLYLAHVPAVTLPLFCGIVAGYLWYDFIHWSTHARAPVTEWGRAQRSHHMAHHFACPDKNFGISHRWIDIALGSLKTRSTGS